MATATKRISQLPTVSDDALTGEAILPVVVSDPLIPNRKSKVSQLFRGIAGGTKSAPGLAFDLDRDTGLYQTTANELGISFGNSYLYHSTGSISNPPLGGSFTTISVQARNTAADNVNISFQPQGSGIFTVDGLASFRDSSFQIYDNVNNDKIAAFDVASISTTSGKKTFSLPPVGTQTGTTLLGTDTSQTITNKTIINVDNSFSLIGSVNSAKIARFEVDSWEVPVTHVFKLPHIGATDLTSTLVDDITEQFVYQKTLVNPKFSDTPSTDPQNPTLFVSFDSSQITADRTVTFPDTNVTLVGTDSTQTISQKIYKGPVFGDTANVNRKAAFDLSNMLTTTILYYGFPSTNLNTIATNVLVTERATQVVRNKNFINSGFSTLDGTKSVSIDTSNITADRTIKFPDSDATLLSTENASLEGISFGGAIAASSFGGRIRLQTHFLSGL